MADDTPHLRVLIANEQSERLDQLAEAVSALGHEVIARAVDIAEIGTTTAREHPDIALIGLGSDPAHALELISQVVRDAACPVIALLSADDPSYVEAAAGRGVFAHIIQQTDAGQLRGALAITLQRFAEYQNLQGAFDRRATIEQAKGILMARHAIEPDRAFEMLRAQSQRSDRKLIDIADAVVQSHVLLLPAHDGGEDAS